MDKIRKIIRKILLENSSRPFDLSEEDLEKIAYWGLEGDYNSSGCWDDAANNVVIAVECAVKNFKLFLSKPYPIELGNVPSNPIVYRLIRLKSVNDLKRNELGTSWFSNPRQFDNPEFFQMLDYLKPYTDNGDGEVYLVKGQTSVNNIDVARSLWERSTQWWENEIVIKDDSNIKILSIQKMTNIA